MGYAIVGGVGLAVGLSLLWWALRERSARHKAERAADKARRGERLAAGRAKSNAAIADRLSSQLNRLERQVKAQRTRLAAVKDLLEKHGTMPLIKAWLDEEGKGGEI